MFPSFLMVGHKVHKNMLKLYISVFISDTFTVAQAVNALGFGWFQVKLSLFVGLCWMSDSMEMTILSVLGPALHCEWNISRYQQALVTTVVFLGMMLSSTFWGSLSDRYGRKPVKIHMFCMLSTHFLTTFSGTHTLWNSIISLWIIKCCCTFSRLASVASWFSWFCDWLCSTECYTLC